MEAGSYAQMTAQVLELASRVGAPVGVVLEGGYDPGALADSVLSTIGALNGQTKPKSIASDPMITSRVAAHVGHFWTHYRKGGSFVIVRRPDRFTRR